MSRQVSNNVGSFHVGMRNWLIVVLLAAILVTQVLILLRIPGMPASPPTYGAWLREQTRDERMKLLLDIPLVRIQGGNIDADITGTVDVEGTVGVEVENTPLEVEVYR